MLISSDGAVVDLGQMAEQAMAKMVQSGKIEQMIETALEKTMRDIVEAQLRSYSTLGKSIEKIVERSFEFDVDRVSPGEYGTMIAKLVQTRLREYMVHEGEQQLAKMLDEILEPAPVEIKLSQLVAELKEEAIDRFRFDRSKPRITAVVEGNKYGSRWLALDAEPDKPKYDCAIRFLLDDLGRIFALTYRDHKVEKFIGRYYGIERTLFWLHSGRTKLIIDEFNVEIPEEMLPEECHCD